MWQIPFWNCCCDVETAVQISILKLAPKARVVHRLIKGRRREADYVRGSAEELQYRLLQRVDTLTGPVVEN